MKKNKKAILATSVATIVVAQAITPIMAIGKTAVESGKWMSGEYHTHTTQSNDASEPVIVVQNVYDAAFGEIDKEGETWKNAKSFEMPVQNTDANGGEFDYLITADHLRPSQRNANGDNHNEDKSNVTFYETLKSQLEKQSELQGSGKYDDKIIYSGFEWDMPGLDHAAVGILADNQDEMLEAVRAFEYYYSKETKDEYYNEEDKNLYGPRRNQNTKDMTYDGVKWLQENYPDSYVLINHAARKNGQSSEIKVEDFRTMNDIAPEIVFGFEGLLGNQMGGDRGESADVFGGADQMLAEVGGMWDALLGEGRKFFTFANSDCHFKVSSNEKYSSGYWPAEYSRNYTWVEGNEIEDVVDGFRSGKSFAVTGDLIDELDFSIESSEDSAEMGEDISVTEGETMTIKIRFKSPEINNYESLFNTNDSVSNKVDVHHVDLISGEVTGKIDKNDDNYTNSKNETTKIVASFTEEDWTLDKDGYNSLEITVPADTNRYYRLRGTNLDYNVEGETDAQGNPLRDEVLTHDGSNQEKFDMINDRNYTDMWFYSNPIFVEVSENTGGGDVEWTNPYSDVNTNDWFYDAVSYTTQKGLFKGTTDTTFAPDTTMTRAMMVQVLHRLEGLPSSNSFNYVDVPDNEWYTDAVNWATENKIVQGVGDNKFNPNESVTREQTAVMIYNYMNFKGIKLNTEGEEIYNDYNQVSEWAKDEVLALKKAGVMNGKGDNIFDPTGLTLRSEGAMATCNLDKYVKTK